MRAVIAAPTSISSSCLPPALNREVVLAAASAGSTSSRKANAESAGERCHHLGPAGGGRLPRPRRRVSLVTGPPRDRPSHPRWRAWTIRRMRASFMLDLWRRSDVPLLWRFRKSLSGRHRHPTPGYHLSNCARSASARSSRPGLTATFITELLYRDAMRLVTAVRSRQTGPLRRDRSMSRTLRPRSSRFEGGAYGVFETSRVAIGKRSPSRFEVHGSRGSAEWELERPDDSVPAGDPSPSLPAGACEPGSPPAQVDCSCGERTAVNWLASARNARCGPSS